MGRSFRVSKEGLEKAEKAFQLKGCTQEYLAGGVGCTRQVVINFFARRTVEKRYFQNICNELHLDWGDIAELELEEQSIHNFNINTEQEVVNQKQKLTEQERTAYVIAGSVARDDIPKLRAIIALLQEITGDTSIKIIDIEEGSIRLILEGSQVGLEQIEALFKSGQLFEVMGIPVEDVQLLNTKTLEATDTKQLAFTIASNLSTEDIQKLKAVFTETLYGNNIHEKAIRLPSSTNRIETNLINRDYTLIIDKSASMLLKDYGEKSRWEIAQESTLALVMTCESFSKDGITVYLFSRRFQRYENVTSREVQRLFKENVPSGGSNLASVLKDATDNYFQRKLAGQTKPNGEVILILTDTELDDYKAVNKVIIEASRRMEHREELAISFIQFGRDLSTTMSFGELDSTTLEQAGAKFDICDFITIQDIEENSINLSEVLLRSIND